MIPLWDTAGLAPRNALPSALPLRFPDTPSGMTRDFTLDATALQTIGTDTLTLTINAIGGGLVLVASVVRGGLVTLWLTTGAPGDGTIDLVLTTQSTRRVHRIIRLRVF
jgi:hypothetical protein